MLSKQVKQRRNANRNKRYLCASKKIRQIAKDAMRTQSGRALLSSKYLRTSRSELEASWVAPSSQAGLSSKHLVQRGELSEFEQQRLALIDTHLENNPDGWVPALQGVVILEDVDTVYPKKVN